MNIDTIYKLVNRYRILEEDFVNIKATKSNKKTIEDLQREQSNIIFKLELPYKLLDLIAIASKEAINVTINNEDNEISVSLQDKEDKYNNCYLNNISCSKYGLDQAYELIETVKQRRIKAEQLDELKEQALAKLTEEEKELLGLNG